MSTPISKQVFTLLESHPWDETIARLALYAKRKMMRLMWRNSREGTPPGGKEPEDIVQEVIARTFDGKRMWDPVKHPDLYPWLQGQVDSLISGLVRSRENRQTISITTFEEMPFLEESETETPERLALEAEKESECETVILEILDFLQTEPELKRIVEAILDSPTGAPKRADLAAKLDITVEELESRKKRLFRRIDAYKQSTKVLETKGGPTNGK